MGIITGFKFFSDILGIGLLEVDATCDLIGPVMMFSDMNTLDTHMYLMSS